MSSKKIVTVLDIGTTKICCCIALLRNDDSYELLGVGYCSSFGVNASIIVNVDDTAKCISTAVENAEKMANIRVNSVYVSIGGKNIESNNIDFQIKIGGRLVQNEDIMKIFDACKNEDDEMETIHSIPITFNIDSLYEIKNPVGMIANELHATMNVVTVPKIQLNNLLLCLSKAHLDAVGVVVSGYAAGLYSIDYNKDVLGTQIVVDFGGGLTTIALFFEGIFCGLKHLSIGGLHVTKDIAYGLNISVANAERLKTLYGAAFVSIADEQEMILIPVIEEESAVTLQQITKSTLNQIIQSRVEEIIDNVKVKITESKFDNCFPLTMFLTGGGSILTGFIDFFSDVLKKKVSRHAKYEFIDGSDIQIGEDFAVAFGMIKFAQSSEDINLKNKYKKSKKTKIGFIKKILIWIEDSL